MNLEEVFKWIESSNDPSCVDSIRKALVLIAINSSAKSSQAREFSQKCKDASKTKVKLENKKVTDLYEQPITLKELPNSLSNVPLELFERLGNITKINKGQTPIQKAIPGLFPLVVTAKTRSTNSTFDFEGPATIIPMVSSTGHGDASLKRIHYQDGQYAVGNILAVVQPNIPELISARFIYEYLSVFKEELLVSRMVGTANVSLTINKIKEIPIPLLSGPVINEINNLMSLCDKLEIQYSETNEAHQILMSQLLATLTQSQNAAEFNDNWQRIYAHFDVLFTTEASIDTLKQTLLQLAVMGKLVPQDPNDEPASELLKRIQAEKAKLIAEGKLKKEKPLAPIGGDEKPFELSKGWKWARLQDFVLSIISGGTPSKTNSEYWDGEIPWASVKDLNVEKYLESTQDTITSLGLEKGSKLANKGDLIICTRMGLGKIAIAAVDVAINQDLKALKLTNLLNIDYFIKFYSTLSITGSGMTVAGIKQDELLRYVVPTPPLAEQYRIIAKVDALLALCDQLKTRIKQSNQQQQVIADALVAQAVN